MPAGIKIVNNWGTILIDDEFPTPVVVGSGSTTIPASGFIRIGDFAGKIAVKATAVVGVRYMTYAEPLPAGMYLFGPPGTNVQWFHITDPVEPPSKVGIWVRNGSGQLMFDTGQKPVRMTGISSGGSRASWSGTFGYDGSRTYAILPMTVAFDSINTFTRVGGGSPNEFYQNETISVAGGAVNGGTITLGMTAASMRSYGPYTGTVLPTRWEVHTDNAALAIIDVTGY